MPPADGRDGPPARTDPLAASLARAAAGDPRAMEQVYRLASRRVRAFLGRLLPPHDVDDALQEVFLAVWRAGSFDPDRAAAMTWILTIARRKAYDRLRAERTSRRVFEPLSGHDARDPRPSWVQRREDLDGRRRLLEALRALPASQREALVAVFGTDLSYVALSRRRGIPATTLKSRIGRALVILRRRLRDT